MYFFIACRPQVTNTGMKVQSLSLLVTEEMTEASESTGNDPGSDNGWESPWFRDEPSTRNEEIPSREKRTSYASQLVRTP